MKIGVYVRCSTLDQDTGLQKRDILEFTKARGWDSVTVYEDAGKSGTTANRPQLKQMMRDVRERKLDAVICWKMDRLFRSLKDLVLTLEEFEDLGVKFISLKDAIDLTTSQGRLLMQLLGAFAEFESNLIRERVRAGLRNAKANGIILGRPQKRDDNRIHCLRFQGRSIREIALELNLSQATVKRSFQEARSLLKSSAKAQ